MWPDSAPPLYARDHGSAPDVSRAIRVAPVVMDAKTLANSPRRFEYLETVPADFVPPVRARVRFFWNKYRDRLDKGETLVADLGYGDTLYIHKSGYTVTKDRS